MGDRINISIITWNNMIFCDVKYLDCEPNKVTQPIAAIILVFQIGSPCIFDDSFAKSHSNS